MISGKEFKELRNKKGLTLKDVAKVLHTSEQAINKYELEIVRNIPLERIEKLAELYGVSPAYIMGWESPAPTAPVLLYEAAAGEGRINDGYPTETYDTNLKQGQILVTVRGRSMENTLLDGDRVVVRSQNVLDHSGQIALVKINGEESTLKRVQISEEGLTLIGDNTSVYPPRFFTPQQVEQLPVKIEGVVVQLIRDID